MKISVIIPTYKPKNYIWECLDSLICQAFSKEDFEIIIVLNGCNEPWRSEIEKYIKVNMNEMNVKLIQTDSPGVSNARNLALDYVKGEYVTFIDDDDYVSANYLQDLCRCSSIDQIGCAHPIAFDENGMRGYSLEKEWKKLSCLGSSNYYKGRKLFQGPCMKLIHHNIIGSRRFDVNFSNGEDSLFMFLISDRFKQVLATRDTAIYYRRVRVDSAAYSKKSFYVKLRNSLRLIFSYLKIYLKHLDSYDFKFFITRVIGAMRMCLN